MFNYIITYNNPQPPQWFTQRFPVCVKFDKLWTLDRYDAPPDILPWFDQNWIKINDNNGGTYCEPNYHREKYPQYYAK